jgi:hypothetical protein
MADQPIAFTMLSPETRAAGGTRAAFVDPSRNRSKNPLVVLRPDAHADVDDLDEHARVGRAGGRGP